MKKQTKEEQLKEIEKRIESEQRKLMKSIEEYNTLSGEKEPNKKAVMLCMGYVNQSIAAGFYGSVNSLANVMSALIAKEKAFADLYKQVSFLKIRDEVMSFADDLKKEMK